MEVLEVLTRLNPGSDQGSANQRGSRAPDPENHSDGVLLCASSVYHHGIEDRLDMVVPLNRL